MLALDPLITAHPMTGAFRPVTADLLAEVYLAPPPPAFDPVLALTMADAPWAHSATIAPQETAHAVLNGLRALALATPDLSPDSVDLNGLDPDSRLFRHLSALTALWRAHPQALPADLQVVAHVLRAAPGDALEALALIDPAPAALSSPVEVALHATLLAHHGLADEGLRAEWQRRRAPLAQGASPGSALARAQVGLTGGGVGAGPLDGTLSFHALRDLAEEADFAAARARRLIDEGTPPHDIALLVPDEPGYHAHLHRACAQAGVPLSGLPPLPSRRDVAGETLLHLVTCLQTPAPAMALASLYVSPLMPWPAATGALMARETMRGHFRPRVAEALTGRAERLFAILRADRPQSAAAVARALERAAQNLSDHPDQREAMAQLRARLPALRALLASGDAPDWPALIRAATPQEVPAESAETFVEGVGVFTENALPWRPARHLIALGMSGARWPRPVAASSLFLGGELVHLQSVTGLRLETRGAQQARRMERLRRQLLSATGLLTLLRPLQGPDGAHLLPAPALALIARTIEGGGDGAPLVHDLRARPPADWPCAHRAVTPAAGGGAPVLPEDGVLVLGLDLLRHRLTDDGLMRPQSPSRLETLLVSPLAWTLAEYGAEAVTWAPETLGIMLAGTLAHDVLEYLFPADAPLPDPEAIDEAVPELLRQAIRRHAPFLQRAIWAVERQGLERELRVAAQVWRTTLTRLGAQVIDNEITLAGEGLGIRLRGRADCLLRLPGNALLIVDHKKSGTAGRRARMEVGWDLQLALYRTMLERPEVTGPVLDAALETRPKIGVAYHLLNDQGVLAQGIDAPPGVVTVMDEGMAEAAMTHLSMRLSEVGAGRVALNRQGDRETFEKERQLSPYALDASPLVARFLMPGDAPETDAEAEND